MTREKSEHIGEQIAAQTKKVTAGQISLELREIPSLTLTIRSATTQQMAFYKLLHHEARAKCVKDEV